MSTVTARTRDGRAVVIEVHRPSCWEDRRDGRRTDEECTCPPSTAPAPQPLDVALEESRAVLARARAARIATEVGDRFVIDVTDRLTPGAKAAARERTTVMDALRTAVVEHQEQHLRSAFDAGRAYERGAAVRRLIGRTAAAREARALDLARQSLEDGDPRAAALVLAGFTGTEVTR